jgi:hypothetical protein
VARDEGEFDVSVHWRRMLEAWGERTGSISAADDDSISLVFDLPDIGRKVTVRFMAVTTLLVAFMTDGHSLKADQLAVAAAAANAWNTEQLVPMLSVWDVRGPQPCLAGCCYLPLACRMTGAGFDALADDWTRRAGEMFTRCHQVFRL